MRYAAVPPEEAPLSARGAPELRREAVSTRSAPRIRDLSRAECDAILARNHVGRIAYAHGNRVDIEPIHYVFHEGWLYGRTSHGAKLEATGYTWWPVAFEVDEVEELFRWRSVVVHGGFYTIPEDGVEGGHEEWERAVERMRTLIPETFTPDDPVAFRRVLFRVAVQEVAGREAVPGDGDGAPDVRASDELRPRVMVQRGRGRRGAGLTSGGARETSNNPGTRR